MQKPFNIGSRIQGTNYAKCFRASVEIHTSTIPIVSIWCPVFRGCCSAYPHYTMYCNFLLMFVVATLSVFYSLEATSFHMLCYSQATPFSLNRSDQLSLARYFCKEPCHCDRKRSSRILLLLVLKKRASCSTNKFYLLILKLLLRLLCLTAYLHLSILMPRARQCQNVIHCSAISFL